MAKKSRVFASGQPVDLSTQDSTVVIAAGGELRLSLAQMLALFDPDLHGGEVMAAGLIDE